MQCFPSSSAGKESAMQETPVRGRSPGEAIGYPLHYSRAPLVAQKVKNLPTIQETLLRFLGREDPLEKGRATHCLENPMDRGAWRATARGSQRVGHD